MSLWKRFRHRLEELACRLLAWIIPRLSRRTCVRLARATGALAFRCDRRGRAIALENLRCAFGEQYSEDERQRIARASYQNFARTMFDLFWGERLHTGNFHDWMKMEGVEAVRERLLSEKRGSVFLGAHQGNWEWASLACGFAGFGNVVVGENFKNPRLTAIFSSLRQRSGQTVLPQEKSLLRMLKIAKRGGATGLLIDLNLPPSQATTVLEAFGPGGLKMCVSMLHAVLAERAGALLVPVESQPQPDGTCRVIVHSPLDVPENASIAQIAQLCWNAFEPIIRARPEEYFWPYKHFRYRPRDAQRPYPSYANESGKFEKLLRQIAS